MAAKAGQCAWPWKGIVTGTGAAGVPCQVCPMYFKNDGATEIPLESAGSAASKVPRRISAQSSGRPCAELSRQGGMRR